jgi:hypothetical protein
VGVSIYYTASRPEMLSPVERSAVESVITRYPLDVLIAECGVAEGEFTGEDFCVYPTDAEAEPGVVFEGATKLPLHSEDAFWAAVQYWCRLLSELRRVMPGTSWRVHVDDHYIAWDEKLRAFDPSAE